MFGVYVATVAVGWDGGVGAGGGGREADLAAEGVEGDADMWRELAPAIGEAPDVDGGVGEFVGEEAEAGNDGRPAPVGWLEVE